APHRLAGVADTRRRVGLDEAAIVARRTRLLGPNLSIAYRRPLHIVRGWMQHLYDAEGRRYLDAVNNVPHVGHSHPRVVQAGQRQMAVLNTNTRYLHEAVVRYAERLEQLLPRPLSVCFFVNSGSEANELALRLAATHTGRRGTLVIDGAYHGNTATLVSLSPYKCQGPGGAGLAPFARALPLPDLYRGAHRADDPTAGHRYAAAADQAIEELAAAGTPVGAFLAESLLSCGGQIVLPPGYLDDVYRRVRAAGGVCIADEVQVGFGRVGSHFWGFETQGVVPDIVVMGKPAGNGHPLGVVVTTPEIAASFANGMEFFSTFGGNPVSAAVGLAVLDVLFDEDLQARALGTGRQLLAGLKGLVARHPAAGDARGLGLFVGLELVSNRDRRTPDAAAASYVANRLRSLGILVSTDGPDHNVIKIKPPLCFSPDDAEMLVAALDRVLGEDAVVAGRR
ncbi:MAG: aminotransferase class III-fold pyridoxal phosphate-dependent enzyme, partial [Gemmatimonadales bacterium]|nr:aminotransferase class III-fold pyridoxal phosphate-dependent enzyme [Gemmatimonadales bacterium]